MAVNASALTGVPASATNVAGAIRQASQTTGASFDYLLATARVESNLNPNLTVRNSSATGLFQFIEQTWLGTMKQAGAAHGYGRYSDAITRTPNGRYVVQDPALRNEIMGLRKDPTANAVMAGAFTRQNAAVLSRRIGRMPTEGELYIAHFFGPGGAAKLIAQAGNNPQATAADAFPAAARANRPIFYDKQGNARSVAGVYTELVRRYQVARANTGAPRRRWPLRRPPCRCRRYRLRAPMSPIRRASPACWPRPTPRRHPHRDRPRHHFMRCFSLPSGAIRWRRRSAKSGVPRPRAPAQRPPRPSRNPQPGRPMPQAPRSTCSKTGRRTCAGCSAAACSRARGARVNVRAILRRFMVNGLLRGAR